MKVVHARKRQRKGKSRCDFDSKRRREIERHARYVDAADTEDFDRWLIAYVWHNSGTKDQIWAVVEASRRMGRTISETDARAILEEADNTRRRWKADTLAKYLGVTFAQRKALKITTIGSVDVKVRARKVLRLRDNRVAKEARRRASGALARAEYEANSIAARARAEGVSRMTIYRRNRAEQATNVTGTPNVTGVDAAFFLNGVDRPVTSEREVGNSSEASPRKQEGYSSSQTATLVRADRYESLPVELRLLALGLIPSIPGEKFRVAA